MNFKTKWIIKKTIMIGLFYESILVPFIYILNYLAPKIFPLGYGPSILIFIMGPIFAYDSARKIYKLKYPNDDDDGPTYIDYKFFERPIHI